MTRFLFSAERHAAFAAASGDHNPIHVDLAHAARLLRGEPVVHGIHTLLVALEHWVEQGGAVPTRLRCSFQAPVCVGDEATLQCSPPSGNDAGRIQLRVAGRPCTTVTLLPPGPAGPEATAPALQPATLPPASQWPLDWPATAQPGLVYAPGPVPGQPAALFPALQAALGEAAIEALANCSRFVGMVCPGRYSLFASLVVDLPGPAAAVQPLSFEIAEFDARFQQFHLRVHGGLTGELRAFRLLPPVAPPAPADIQALVQPGEFAGQRALVIGGSRGLGACTALLLAAGGADVTLTWHHNQAEAEALCATIRQHWGPRCQLAAFDITHTRDDSLRALVQATDAVFLFASPRIRKSERGHTDETLLQQYRQYYVEALARVAALAAPRPVFLPSTVFLDSPGHGFNEYAQAKAEAEAWATAFNDSQPAPVVHSVRLPALLTDQTLPIGQARADAPAAPAVLLPCLRALLRR